MPDGDIELTFRLITSLSELLDKIGVVHVHDNSPEAKIIGEAIAAQANVIFEDYVRSRNTEVLGFIRQIKAVEYMEPEEFKKHIMKAVDTSAQIIVNDLGVEL